MWFVSSSGCTLHLNNLRHDIRPVGVRIRIGSNAFLVCKRQRSCNFQIKWWPLNPYSHTDAVVPPAFESHLLVATRDDGMNRRNRECGSRPYGFKANAIIYVWTYRSNICCNIVSLWARTFRGRWLMWRTYFPCLWHVVRDGTGFDYIRGFPRGPILIRVIVLESPTAIILNTVKVLCKNDSLVISNIFVDTRCSTWFQWTSHYVPDLRQEWWGLKSRKFTPVAGLEHDMRCWMETSWTECIEEDI